MKNQIFLLSIGSGGMNILHDIKCLKIENCRFLYINNIDYKAKEDNFEPIFDKIDKKEKIILNQDNLEEKLSNFLLSTKQINIVITLGSQTAMISPKILAFILNNLSLKVNIYAIYPFHFENKEIIKRADETLSNIKQITENIFLFYNDKLFEKGHNIKMQELFKSLSEEIYNHIKSHHDL